MAEVVYEGHVCADCASAIASGDESGVPEDMYDEWLAGIEATTLFEVGAVVLACEEDCDGYFSYSPCDYCGSRLGGDRHPIAVLSR